MKPTQKIIKINAALANANADKMFLSISFIPNIGITPAQIARDAGPTGYFNHFRAYQSRVFVRNFLASIGDAGNGRH